MGGGWWWVVGGGRVYNITVRKHLCAFFCDVDTVRDIRTNGDSTAYLRNVVVVGVVPLHL